MELLFAVGILLYLLSYEFQLNTLKTPAGGDINLWKFVWYFIASTDLQIKIGYTKNVKN